MKTAIYLLAFCSILIVGGIGMVVPPPVITSGGGPLPDAIHLIGNVDGKSIFVDDVSRRDWVDSGIYCETMGMRLASITSPEQAALLLNSHDSFFNGSFWTSGRDSQQHRQFAWNDDDTTAPNSTYLDLGNSTMPYMTCLLFHSFAANQTHSPHLDMQPCTRLFGVLCETH